MFYCKFFNFLKPEILTKKTLPPILVIIGDRMTKKYKIALSSVSIIFILILLIGVGYLFFEKPFSKSDNAYVFVDGDLSFNFLEGNQIDTNNTEIKINFSVTNTSNIPYFYNINLKDVNQTEQANFILEGTRTGFQTITKKYPNEDLTLASTIRINGLETHSYTFTIQNTNQEQIKGTLITELEKDMSTLSNMILKNNIVNTSTKTPIASSIATEEEGLIESSDDYGTSYYFRGASENNYVSFAGFLWRIVKINGDGTVKLVLNSLINNNTQYYTGEYDLTLENSNIYQILNSWYNENLKEYDNNIASFSFCSDDTTDSLGFSSITRIYTNHAPIFQCLGSTSHLKIGLLTADELSFAGATNQENNQNFYLYNDEIKTSWWTMSPAKNTNDTYSFIEVSKDGKLNDGTNGHLFRGNRPVINITRRTTATGTGTLTDPYKVNNT